MTNSNISVAGKHDIDMINSAKLSVSRFSLVFQPRRNAVSNKFCRFFSTYLTQLLMTKICKCDTSL